MEVKEPLKTTAVKATESAKKVRAMVKGMSLRAAEARSQGKLLAYCMAESQYDEIIRAIDIVPVWTENYAGVCAAKRDTERFLMKAESDGYSNVVCSYVRIGLGFDSLRRELGGPPPNAPQGGMPLPDMLLGSSSRCDPRYKWYQALGHYMNVPTYNIDMVVPPADANLKEVTDYYVRYQYEQYKGLVAFLERQTGEPLDRERLWDAIRKGDEAWRLWYEVDRLRRAIPSPMPSQDHFNVMVPAAYLSGTDEAVTFFRELYDEVKSRVASKIGVIPDEKYRLLYGGGPPPWHTMWMFNFFESLGAVFVMENMYRGYDPVEVPAKVKDPVEYIAWRCFLRRTQRYHKARKHTGHPVAERLLEFIEDYKIDGLVFHACRSCRANTVGQTYIKELLRQYTSIPIIQLTSDMIDLRDYSEAQWKAQITAFVEAVAAHKNQRNK